MYGMWIAEWGGRWCTALIELKREWLSIRRCPSPPSRLHSRTYFRRLGRADASLLVTIGDSRPRVTWSVASLLGRWAMMSREVAHSCPEVPPISPLCFVERRVYFNPTTPPLVVPLCLE